MAALDRIRTIIILMLENRSFDHMLGHLSLPPFNREDVNGLRADQDWLNAHTNMDGLNGSTPFHSTNPYDLPEGFDPPHERADIERQLGEITESRYPMNGFINALPQAVSSDPEVRKQVMSYFGADEVPISHFLAQHFTIADNWFCSLPAGTQANRLMAMGGESVIDTNHVPLPNQELVYDWLDARKISWRVYHEGIPFFALIPGRIPKVLGNRFRDFRHFHQDILNTAPSKLPQVIFVEPTYGDAPKMGVSSDDHAPSGVADGQDFLMQVYNAVTASERFWKGAVLVTTYDEHGGFFDHVSPPLIVTKPPQSGAYRPFASLGVRVPAYIVSPWVKPGGVSHSIYDHTSILKLLAEKFDPNGSYSEAVDSRPVASLSDVLIETAPILPSPVVPPVDAYLGGRPPKPTAPSAPAQDSVLREAFRQTISELRNQEVDERNETYGPLLGFTPEN